MQVFYGLVRFLPQTAEGILGFQARIGIIWSLKIQGIENILSVEFRGICSLPYPTTTCC